MNKYVEARVYLQEYRLQFDKTMAPEMKEALLIAEEALLNQAIENDKITYISPIEIERIKNDTR